MTLSTGAPTPMSAARLSMLSPGIDALSHSTLPLVQRFHTRVLTAKNNSSPTNDNINDNNDNKFPIYEPRSSNPINESNFSIYQQIESPIITPLNASESLLLATLTEENEKRVASEKRLKTHVESLVRDWNEKRARVEEEANRIQEIERIQRAQQIKQREQQKLSLQNNSMNNNNDNKNTNQQPWTLPASSTNTVTSSTSNNSPLTDSTGKIFQSELSSPIINSTLTEIKSLINGNSQYIGSAINVSFSPFCQGDVQVTEKAKSLIHTNPSLNNNSNNNNKDNDNDTSENNNDKNSLTDSSSSSLNSMNRAWFDAACGKISPYRPQSQPLALEASRHRLLHEEVNEVKNRLIKNGISVSQGTIERALGLDRQSHKLSALQQAGQSSINNNNNWAIPFSTLVENPNEKKKKNSTEKKSNKKSKGKK